MAELADFLLARLDEDEAMAQATRTDPWDEIAFHDQAADDIPHIARHGPARVLAECEAKRVAVDWYLNDDDTVMGPTVRALAAVYADHPDFQEAWRSGR